MSPTFKPIAEMLLQARVSGKLMDSTDFFDILHSNKISPNVDVRELSDFMSEIIPCDEMENALEVAEKYGLTIYI
jgi:hypothetical protein